MTGPQCAHHQVESLGKPLIKLGKTCAASLQHEGKWQIARNDTDQDGKNHRFGAQINQICGNDEANRGDDKQTPHSPLQIGLVKQRAQARSKLKLQQPAVDPGNRAQQFALSDIDNLIA